MRLLASIAASVLLGCTLFLSGCSTSGVQDVRYSGVERRQNRMDSRVSARQERWQERGDREDARARARLESW